MADWSENLEQGQTYRRVCLKNGEVRCNVLYSGAPNPDLLEFLFNEQDGFNDRIHSICWTVAKSEVASVSEEWPGRKYARVRDRLLENRSMREKAIPVEDFEK